MAFDSKALIGFESKITETEEQALQKLRKGAEKEINRVLSDAEKNAIRTNDQVAEKTRKLILKFIDQEFQKFASNPEGAWPDIEHEKLAIQIFRVLYGLGPYEELLEDSTVEDIAINGPNEVFIRTSEGWSEIPPSRLSEIGGDPEAVRRIFNNALSSGQQAGELNPIVDDKLPNGGHRISIIQEPVAADAWPLIVIRRHRESKFTMDDYLKSPVSGYKHKSLEIPDYLEGWNQDALLTPSAAAFLHMAMLAGFNTILIGRTGVGKTSFLNALGGMIPEDRRILVVEDTRELRLRAGDRPQNCVYVVSIKERQEGSLEVTPSSIVKAALRQRPDHLVMGEARGAEMWDLIQAMQTGHGGMLTSVHALDARELVGRVEYMVKEAGVDRTQKQVANLISASFHVAITLLMDLSSGRRYIKEIAVFKGRLPEEAPGDVPNLDIIFKGGPENEYRLNLTDLKEFALERDLLRLGLTFDIVREIAKKEKKLVST